MFNACPKPTSRQAAPQAEAEAEAKARGQASLHQEHTLLIFSSFSPTFLFTRPMQIDRDGALSSFADHPFNLFFLPSVYNKFSFACLLVSFASRSLFNPLLETLYLCDIYPLKNEPNHVFCFLLHL